MTVSSRTWFGILLGFVAATAVGPTMAATDASGETIEQTIRRYFESLPEFHEGDLISQSHVEDIQQYLLKTQGHIPATHPHILKRALPDRSPLVRCYYKQNGSELLREAARSLGSYGPLESMLRTGRGRAIVLQAIDSEDPSLLLTELKKTSPDDTGQGDPAHAGAEHSASPKRIYTVEELIEAAVHTAKNESAPVPGRADQAAGG